MAMRALTLSISAAKMSLLGGALVIVICWFGLGGLWRRFCEELVEAEYFKVGGRVLCVWKKRDRAKGDE
jgi:hypothetical protein